ncbi:MAG: hypothetical protein U0235_12855 [Polyangiaceae bacterium]
MAQEGVDMALLAERRAFLRPDSLVAIVLLTDEDGVVGRAGRLRWPCVVLRRQPARATGHDRVCGGP